MSTIQMMSCLRLQLRNVFGKWPTHAVSNIFVIIDRKYFVKIHCWNVSRPFSKNKPNKLNVRNNMRNMRWHTVSNFMHILRNWFINIYSINKKFFFFTSSGKWSVLKNEFHLNASENQCLTFQINICKCELLSYICLGQSIVRVHFYVIMVFFSHYDVYFPFKHFFLMIQISNTDSFCYAFEMFSLCVLAFLLLP